MRYTQLLFFSTVAATLAGCAGEDAARRMADTSAALTNQFNVETQAFFKDQNTLNQVTSEAIDRRKRDATTLASQNRIQRATWIAQGDKAAVEIYDALSGASAETLLATNVDLETLHPTTVTPLAPVDPKPFDDVAAALKKLATKPSLEERGAFVFTEGKAVYDGYKASLKKGSDTAQTATAATPPAK